jgi:hypothetical protein
MVLADLRVRRLIHQVRLSAKGMAALDLQALGASADPDVVRPVFGLWGRKEVVRDFRLWALAGGPVSGGLLFRSHWKPQPDELRKVARAGVREFLAPVVAQALLLAVARAPLA